MAKCLQRREIKFETKTNTSFGGYSRKELLEVLRGYRRMIERNGREYPTVVLDDIYHSIVHVLRENGG